MQRCCMTVLKCVLLVNRNVTEMYANRGSWIVDRGSWIVDRGSWIMDRGSWNAHCFISKVEILSLEFKWLIVLRSAIKRHDQTHRILKNAFTAS